MHVFSVNLIDRKPSVTFLSIPHTKFHLQCKLWDKFCVWYSYPLEKSWNTDRIDIEDSGAKLALKRFLTITLSERFEWSFPGTFLTKCIWLEMHDEFKKNIKFCLVYQLQMSTRIENQAESIPPDILLALSDKIALDIQDRVTKYTILVRLQTETNWDINRLLHCGDCYHILHWL